MKGIAHVIGISKKMEDADAIAYLEYHRHMQTIKLKRLEREVSATKEAIAKFEDEIKRRKCEGEER